jgi:hypothetical protein
MNERLDFENHNMDVLEDKTVLQAEIDQHVAEFLAKGGKIETLDYDHTTEILARVGQWSEMGSAPIENQQEGYDSIETLPYV